MRIQPGEAQGYRLFLDDPFPNHRIANLFQREPYQRLACPKGVFPSGPYGKKYDGLVD